MIEGLFGLIAVLGMIWGAVVQQNTVLFDIMALIFVVGIGFFYALACGGDTCGGDKWQRLENFGEASILAGTLGFFIGLANLVAIEDAPPQAMQIAILTLIYGYTLKFICSALVKSFGNS